MPDQPSPTDIPGVDPEGRLALTVTAEDAGNRVDRHLGRLLAPHYSRSYLSALLDEGTLRVGGRKSRPSYRLAEGDRIEGALGIPASALPGPEDGIEYRVIHSDPAIIVIDKPSGLVIHPGAGRKGGTLVNGLLKEFPEIAVVGRAERPGIVHRLDRDTTGVMVVARTNEAAKSLVGQFKRKTVEKRYTAVVWGEMPFDSDWIDLSIDIDPRKPVLRTVVSEGGQTASTFYEVEERLGPATVVTAMPRTGRTHQIRVHLSHLGFPILLDPPYGRRITGSWNGWFERRKKAGLPVPTMSRHALHARHLTLDHPETGERVTYEAPLPMDMVELIEILRES